MREKLVSPLFGESELASLEEQAFLDQLAKECPVSVFQTLNRFLNTRGIAIYMTTLQRAVPL